VQSQTIWTYGHKHDIKHIESVWQVSTDVEAFTINRDYCYTEHDTIFRAMLLHGTLVLYIRSRKFTLRFLIILYDWNMI